MSWRRSIGCVIALVLAWCASPAAAQYEIVQGFDNAPARGPQQALGLVIWNHGLSGQRDQSPTPPPYMRRLYAAGWDVISIKREGRYERGGWDGAGQKHVARTLDEVTRAKADGYHRIILAGQSYGGAITLEAARRVDVYAIIPSAPGTGVSMEMLGSPLLDTRGSAHLYAALEDGRFERAVPILPFADEFATASPERGQRARRILASRRVPALIFDEQSTKLASHGASSSALMDFAYGACLAAFLDPRQSRPVGLNQCGADGLPASPDMLAETLTLKPAALPRHEIWGPMEGVWVGAWSDPVLVSVAIEKAAEGYELVYLYGGRSSTKLRTTYRAPARVEGRNVVADLPHQRLLLSVEFTTRLLVLSWQSKEGRTGSIKLRRLDS